MEGGGRAGGPVRETRPEQERLHLFFGNDFQFRHVVGVKEKIKMKMKMIPSSCPLTQKAGFSRHKLVLLGLVVLMCPLAGCSSSDDEPPPEQEMATFEQQVERGGTLYGTHCAECHGNAGQGTSEAPAVVGEGALPRTPPATRTVRTAEFETALDVFVFASENMPGDDPGSLADQEMVDILAFALFANGVVLEEPLGFENAGDIVINPQ